MRFTLEPQEPPRRRLVFDDISVLYDQLAEQMRETPGVWFYLNPALEQINGVVTSGIGTLRRRGLIISQRTIDDSLHIWGMAPDLSLEEE